MDVGYTYGISDWGLPPIVRGEGNHILACPRYPVRKLIRFDDDGNVIEGAPGNLLPVKWIEQAQQNQKIASCCRHPENHEIVAWYSCQAEADAGTPDVYIMHCTCGRQHRRLCVGGGKRPFWSVA